MKICAAMAWYDEPLPFLNRCIRSLAGIADTLIAVDGRWNLHGEDDDPFVSAEDEYDTIRDAAAAVGIAVQTLTPVAPWNSQVEKRSFLMQRATETGCDWILVIDGDEEITRCHTEQLHAELQGTALDVAEVMGTNTNPDRGPHPWRRIYRASTEVTVQHWHNGYQTADGRWLHGPARHVQREPTLDLSGLIHIVNERYGRGKARDRTQGRYYRRRGVLRVERLR